jgi:hypothetical protein
LQFKKSNSTINYKSKEGKRIMPQANTQVIQGTANQVDADDTMPISFEQKAKDIISFAAIQPCKSLDQLVPAYDSAHIRAMKLQALADAAAAQVKLAELEMEDFYVEQACIQNYADLSRVKTLDDMVNPCDTAQVRATKLQALATAATCQATLANMGLERFYFDQVGVQKVKQDIILHRINNTIKKIEDAKTGKVKKSKKGLIIGSILAVLGVAGAAVGVVAALFYFNII